MLTWTFLARLAIVATLPLLLMARLPSGEVMWGFLLTGLALLHCPYQPVRLSGITLLLLAWACNDGPSDGAGYRKVLGASCHLHPSDQ